MSFFGKNPNFDKLVDKSTSHLLLEPDWNANLMVCDMIRQGEVTGKYAMQVVRKKLSHNNPHVVMYGLNLIEAMAKNCGSSIHDEIGTSDFMNQMKGLVREKEPIRSKALELIQLWAHAFRNQPKYHVVQSTYLFFKQSGVSFPPIVESDAMFMSETAPEWQDSDSCYRCKVVFSTLRRKHHCRNCGNIFCDECTQKRSNIPKYGIEKEVRVCDACHDLLKGGGMSSKNKKGSVQFNEDVHVKNYQPDDKEAWLNKDAEAAKLKEKELELQEKEELELALALSASEAETQKMKKSKSPTRTQQSASTPQPTPTNQTGFNGMYATLDTTEMDPELARYLNRNYWENKAGSPHEGGKFSPIGSNTPITQPSAPIMPSSPTNVRQAGSSHGHSKKSKDIVVNSNGPSKSSHISAEQEEFLAALRGSIEIFVNRMQSNKQRGRSIANDSAVQTLFLTLNAMHPQLLQYLNEQDDKRNYYENLQDKLAQLRDAREALDALRDEHREKRRQEEEEANRLRQIQMMQKLEVMRQKKKEYLDYQRQLAVDRMHQQEREMAIRMAQQNQMMQMRQYQQQYPYSMQQQQVPQGSEQMNAGIPNYQPQLQQPPQQQQQQPDIYGNTYRMPTGAPNHMSTQPQTDFYNMQGLNQSLPPNTDPNSLHYLPTQPTQMLSQPPTGTQQQQQQIQQPPPPPPNPTNNNTTGGDWNNTQPIQQLSTNTDDDQSKQLISFD